MDITEVEVVTVVADTTEVVTVTVGDTMTVADTMIEEAMTDGVVVIMIKGGTMTVVVIMIGVEDTTGDIKTVVTMIGAVVGTTTMETEGDTTTREGKETLMLYTKKLSCMIEGADVNIQDSFLICFFLDKCILWVLAICYSTKLYIIFRNLPQQHIFSLNQIESTCK